MSIISPFFFQCIIQLVSEFRMLFFYCNTGSFKKTVNDFGNFGKLIWSYCLIKTVCFIYITIMTFLSTIIIIVPLYVNRSHHNISSFQHELCLLNTTKKFWFYVGSDFAMNLSPPVTGNVTVNFPFTIIYSCTMSESSIIN